MVALDTKVSHFHQYVQKYIGKTRSTGDYNKTDNSANIYFIWEGHLSFSNPIYSSVERHQLCTYTFLLHINWGLHYLAYSKYTSLENKQKKYKTVHNFKAGQTSSKRLRITKSFDIASDSPTVRNSWIQRFQRKGEAQEKTKRPLM